jgi:hypothetical protein
VSDNIFQSTGGYFGYGMWVLHRKGETDADSFASATGGMNRVTTSGNDFSAAKFNGAPSYACIDDYMPPAPQAMVADPFSTTGGSYQRGTAAADLMLLPCIMSCEFTEQGCTWPAWYRKEDLVALPSSSVASSMASSSARSSSAVKSSSSAKALSSSAKTSSSVKASSTAAKVSSTAKVTSSVKATSSLSPTGNIKQVTTPTGTVKAKTTAKVSSTKKATTTAKTTTTKKVQATKKSQVKKPVPTPPKKQPKKQPAKGKRAEEDEQWVWSNVADVAEEVDAPERDPAAFLNAGYGRNVYERSHLSDFVVDA